MNEVEDIKSRIDIVEFIGQYLTLKKSGPNYKGLCPFHQEKTPSFMVSPDKQIFKCFGCSEFGDVFGFVMKMENLEFVEALKMLADKTGVQLSTNKKTKEQYQEEKDIKSKLYQINRWSAKIFHKIMLEHPSAKLANQYLQSRKITKDTIKDFMIGYAPSKRVVRQFLIDKGFSEREIIAAGSPDNFFNRIIFPINDPAGRPIGFTGRTLDDKVQPKYLNTPETEIFHKGNILFGLDLARQFIKEQKSTIVVEGQMDVVSSFQAGVKNVVASSGTALTPQHLKTLYRYSQNISFAFDQDEAGSKAAKKAIELAIIADFNVKVVVLPKEFKDAGEIIEQDPSLWSKAVKSAKPAIDWFFDQAFLGKLASASAEKKEIAKIILPMIKIIPDKIEQEHYIKILAKKLSVSDRIIAEALQKIKAPTYYQSEPTPESVETSQQHSLSPEENLIGLLLAYPQYWSKVMIKLDYPDFRPNSLDAKIYKFLEACYTNDSCGKKCDKCQASTNVLICLGKKLSGEELKKAKFLIFEAENRNRNATEEEIIADINQSLLRIKKNKQDATKIDFAQQISQAEDAGNREKVKQLLKELQYAIKKKG